MISYQCDNCGRAVGRAKAVTFPNSDVVICRRANCEPVADRAKTRYYDDEVDCLSEVLSL